MATPGYNFESHDAGRVYTPSMDSDEELPRLDNLALTDKNYRLFSFRRDGRSWAQSQYSESSLPESDIKARAKRVKKPKHTVEAQMDKMSPPRKNAIEDLVERIKRRDPVGDDWDIVAIENEKPELTKRTGEVVAFSVILARASSTRSSTKPVSQERRRSSSYTQNPEINVPGRRGSKAYNPQSPTSNRQSQNFKPSQPFFGSATQGNAFTQSPTLDRSNRQSQGLKPGQPILEDDPFGTKNLFSPENGKPIDPLGSTPFKKPGKLGNTIFGESIGAKQSNLPKDKPGKTPKKPKDEGMIDLDALLGLSSNGPDLLTDPLEDDHHDYNQGHHSDDYDHDSPIEIEVDDLDPKPRGRKRNDSGFASKTPKRSSPGTNTKSKSRPRGLSVNIPGQWPTQPLGADPLDTPKFDTSKYASHPIDVTSQDKYSSRHAEKLPRDRYASRPINVTSAGGRRQQPYHSSRISAETAPSARSYSDHSLIEAEYEEYSSSGSSEDLSPHHQHSHPQEWRSGYTQPDGRYQRATRDHRRGPPSPQQPRYDPDQVPYTPSSRRPRSERFVSDGAIQPYYTPTSASFTRPIINQTQSQSRFDYAQPPHTPSSALYNHESTLPYPSELRTRDAERYMASERDKDQEIQRLQWERDMARSERDLARKEAELHQAIARQASVSIRSSRRDRDREGGGGSRYTHEPRLSRRYTDAYHG